MSQTFNYTMILYDSNLNDEMTLMMNNI